MTSSFHKAPRSQEVSGCDDDKPTVELESTITPQRRDSQTPDHVGVQKNFSLISLAGIGVVVGNVWPALGGSLLTSIYNGGAPGVIYEFIAASLCYFAIAAVISELASALPSSSGVHLWATVTSGPRHGKVVGYFAGWWNCLAWIFAVASVTCISSNLCVQTFAFWHPGFIAKKWHTFVCYIILSWLSCAIVCFGNSVIPRLNVAGLAVIVIGAITTIVVCVAMVNTEGYGPASSHDVWQAWDADIGYPNGFVFTSGMLNDAFAMGTPDAAVHLAEEIPRPSINVPKAIAAQYLLGFVSALAYLITMLYCITDYEALYKAELPIAEVYSQATGHSVAATTALLVLILAPMLLCTLGLYVTCGRTLWTLARVGATPFPNLLGRISPTQHMPVAATLTTTVLVSLLGLIYLAAFNSFVASFILFSSASYIAALLPHLWRRSRPSFEPGWFYMTGYLGYVMNIWACMYLVTWFVVYCFPYALPTNAEDMNYSSLIWGSFQIQDDFLDCYGATEEIGEDCSDIRDGKFSWLIVQAMQRASPEQRRSLQVSYGQAEGQEQVKKIYDQLALKDVYHALEEAKASEIRVKISHIDRAMD